MASLSLYKSSIQIFLLLLTSSLFASTSSASVLENICSKTKNKALCLKELETDPNRPRATLLQLAQITIDAVEYNAGQTKIKIHSFLLSTKVPRLHQIYVQCENLYLDALAKVLTTYDDLKAGRYHALESKATFVRNAPIKCEALLQKYKSPFKTENHLVEVLSDALVIEARDLLVS